MNKEILRLAIPNIISNISIPLLATVDTALMGRLTAAHLGAVGLGSMIFSFVYWNFGFLRMGTTGMTSQAYGRSDADAICNNLWRPALLAVLLSAVILLLQVPFYTGGVYLMNVLPDQLPILSDYFFTRIWAAPATLLLYVIMGWLFGLQNAIYPMILTIVINVVNIICSYYCVEHLGMQARGVAIGTVIAQYVGLGVGVCMILYKYKPFVVLLRLEALAQLTELKIFMHINKDLFIRTVCLTIAFGFFYSKSSEAGPIILATNVILLQYVNWMSYGIDGFAYASEALVGKYYGAGNQAMLGRSITYSMYWGLVLAACYSSIYYWGGDYLLYLFTDDIAIVDYARPYLWWVAVLPLVGYACYIWDGIYVGLTASKSLRNTMLVALAVYLATYYLASHLNQMHRLWLSLVVLLGIRGLMQWLLYWRHGSDLT